MTTTRLWIIAGIAAFVAIVIGIVAAVVGPTLPTPAPGATPEVTTSAAPAPSLDSTPTPTPTPTPRPTSSAFEPSCEDTVTAAFAAQMQAEGHAPQDVTNDSAAPRPFDAFLDGTPEDTLVCRWGAPGATVDLAWTVLPEEAIAAFVEQHVEGGSMLTEVPEGRLLDLGAAGTYLFTVTDARWATSLGDIAHITSPYDRG